MWWILQFEKILKDFCKQILIKTKMVLFVLEIKFGGVDLE